MARHRTHKHASQWRLASTGLSIHPASSNSPLHPPRRTERTRPACGAARAPTAPAPEAAGPAGGATPRHAALAHRPARLRTPAPAAPACQWRAPPPAAGGTAGRAQRARAAAAAPRRQRCWWATPVCPEGGTGTPRCRLARFHPPLLPPPWGCPSAAAAAAELRLQCGWLLLLFGWLLPQPQRSPWRWRRQRRRRFPRAAAAPAGAEAPAAAPRPSTERPGGRP